MEGGARLVIWASIRSLAVTDSDSAGTKATRSTTMYNDNRYHRCIMYNHILLSLDIILGCPVTEWHFSFGPHFIEVQCLIMDLGALISWWHAQAARMCLNAFRSSPVSA